MLFLLGILHRLSPFNGRTEITKQLFPYILHSFLTSSEVSIWHMEIKSKLCMAVMRVRIHWEGKVY